MAGPDPAGLFDGAAFRDDIRAAMLMATPNAVDERVTFIFPRDVDENVPTDDLGRPIDFGSGPTPAAVDDTPAPRLQKADPDDDEGIACVVDWGGDAGTDTATRLGPVKKSTGELILFDEEWDQVSDFVFVEIGGDRYARDEHVTYAMNDVDVHIVRIVARGGAR